MRKAEIIKRKIQEERRRQAENHWNITTIYKIGSAIVAFALLYLLFKNLLGSTSAKLSSASDKSVRRKIPQSEMGPLVASVWQKEQAQQLRELAARATIECKAGFYEELRQHGRQATIQLIENQIKQIRELLPKVFHLNVLREILSDNTLKIILVPANDPELTNNGAAFPDAQYKPRTNRILFCIDTDFTNIEVIRTLRNELHHALMRKKNAEKTEQKSLSENVAYTPLLPFLNNDASINQKNKDLLNKAIEDGFRNIARLEFLLNSNLSQGNKQELDNYLSAFESYEPQVFRHEFPKAQFLELMKRAKPIGKHFLIQEPGIPPMMIVAHVTRGGETTMRYTTAASDSLVDKARSFIYDMQNERKNIQSGNYRHLPSYFKTAEHCSSLHEIDGRVLKRFFPSWCRLISDYTNLEEVCDSTSQTSNKL